MRVLGFEISFSKAIDSVRLPVDARMVGDRGRWWHSIIYEPYTGAWQKNDEYRPETVLAMHAVYACIERIASDVAKCRLKLVEQDANKIWVETDSAAFSPVLRKPNHFQTRIQFFENWIMSKLTAGNTYVLKERDARKVVTALYVLDPRAVRVLVTPASDVYYELNQDYLAGLNATEQITVPASEIIHDMTTVRWHPLCGIPPMIAAFGPAMNSLKIGQASNTFFRNNATPGGVLTAPGEIKEHTAKRLKEYWQTEFAGDNSGKIAVLGDGLKFEPMTITAMNAQLVEQGGMTAQMVCSAFGVPAYMVGVGPLPPYNNIEALNQQYYSQCLQKYFESIELLYDEGLGLVDVLNRVLGTEFELDDLLRMDTMTMIEAIDKAVKAGVMKPNEGRARLNYGPVPGGNAAYLQQQNYSLAALAKRDAKEDPFASAKPAAPPPPKEPPASDSGDGDGGTEEEASMDDIEMARIRLRASIEVRASA